MLRTIEDILKNISSPNEKITLDKFMYVIEKK